MLAISPRKVRISRPIILNEIFKWTLAQVCLAMARLEEKAFTKDDTTTNEVSSALSETEVRFLETLVPIHVVGVSYVGSNKVILHYTTRSRPRIFF